VGVVSHLTPVPDVPIQVFLSDDPDLALVHADLNTWADAHPCDCETMCECDDKKEEA
jgi:hypothetical protein